MSIKTKIEDVIQPVCSIVLLDRETQKAGQDQLRKSILSIDQETHKWAVQAMLHASVHGDTSLMTRLLVNVIDAKTGYRRQGLINWVRKFSPMELKGTTIDLSGIMTAEGIVSLARQFPHKDKAIFGKAGARRPFLVELANDTPFWTDSDNAERVGRAVYKDTLMAKIDSAIKEFYFAIDNTVNGKPIDPTKAFYDGLYADKLTDFFQAVSEMKSALPADQTREVRRAQQRISKDIDFVVANEPKHEEERFAEVA